jgi:hypothetical protein
MDIPSAKRLHTDQSFLKDVLDLNMISLSSRFTNRDMDSQETNVVLQMSSASTYQLNVQNCQSNSRQTNETGVIPKSNSTNTSIVAKQLIELPNYINTNMNKSNSTCIWPEGTSYQPDFIEIVVTDAEMNAYWDTIKDFF